MLRREVGESPCGRTMAKVIQRLRGVVGTLREQVCLGIGQPSPHSNWTSIEQNASQRDDFARQIVRTSLITPALRG
ncbi:hypothetical protein Sar04_48480 [Salinispora arenicola]|uniref:Uncharacterized protein n=2 Tax=Salinispora arenicola TaxID=168697 RepID=A0ABQ4K1H1_SALAC|nr:hypothetical protein Sar04_48480 [Salinispora arenicola]